ncbi:MAG: MgtC/SapB family protein [Candidatus Omnitrophica bacterium]|nr:MgtC/SapB family protein [Candidatus Omnitrophota bacterium]HOX54169.1 MgtC/SapB family protein [Candidatus Omnitrophota bacterium]
MLTHRELVIRLMMSVIFGGLIGLERELRHRGAGFRTHTLVSIGSALIMLTSLYVFDIYKDVANVDPSRIAAGVITGIGFLCAGTIMRYGGSVRGLTTAACLWVTAAVGMACGCGFFYAAFVSTVIILIVLLIFRKFETHLGKD